MIARLSLQSRVLAGCILVVLCSMILVGGVLDRSLRSLMVTQIRDTLFKHLVLMREIMSVRLPSGAPMSMTDQMADQMGAGLLLRVTLIAQDGTVVGDSQVTGAALASLENHLDRPEVTQSLAKGEGWDIRYSNTLDVDFLYVAGILGTPSDPGMIVRLAVPLSDVERTLAGLRRVILEACLLGLLLSMAVAYLVARGVSRQVRELTAMAQRISSGDLSQRLRRYPPYEIGELGRAFDRMADHLQKEVQEVTQTRDRLEATLSGMVEGVLMTGPDGRILLVNRALRDLLRVEVNPVGRTPSEILRNADLQEAIQRALQGEPHLSLEIRTLGLHRRVLEVHVVGLSEGERRTGAVAVFHDVTERNRLEEVRRDFVANVSHELRTPLTAIRGSVETLLGGAGDDPQHGRRFLEMIGRHVTRLQGLLDDLLNLARVESHEIHLKQEEIRGADLAQTVLTSVAELASSRGIELVTDLPEPEIILRGDPQQLEQALLNLLDNGIKYTEQGGRVTLRIERQGEEVRMEVKDTGIGIPPEHLPRIFERFYRVDRARSRELGGTGLGLSIVKHIAQSHGGRVEVESFPGMGSSFRIVLPG